MDPYVDSLRARVQRSQHVSQLPPYSSPASHAHYPTVSPYAQSRKVNTVPRAVRWSSISQQSPEAMLPLPNLNTTSRAAKCTQQMQKISSNSSQIDATIEQTRRGTCASLFEIIAELIKFQNHHRSANIETTSRTMKGNQWKMTYLKDLCEAQKALLKG